MSSQGYDPAMAMSVAGQQVNQYHDNALMGFDVAESAPSFVQYCNAFPGPLYYAYAWPSMDYTPLNVIHTTPSYGIMQCADSHSQSLLTTHTASQVPTIAQAYEPHPSWPSSGRRDPNLQDISNLHVPALQPQQPIQNLSAVLRDPMPPRYRCYDHGCYGRSFSSRSNLRRHQRERAHLTRNLPCPFCGIQFYRRWTRDQHILRATCLLRMPTCSGYFDNDKDALYRQF